MNEKGIINMNNKKSKPFYKKIWIWVLIVVILAVGGVALSMPFSYGVQKVLLRAVCSPRNISTPENYDTILSNTDITKDITYNSTYENNNMDIIAPKNNTQNLPLFVYLHGGYYIGGDKKSAEPYCRMIAKEGYIVANVNYMLAPDEHYPAQAIQANEAIDFLIENADTYNIDENNIFIGGDSAGSHLSGYMGAYYSNNELSSEIETIPAINNSQLKGVVLLCGFYDMSTVRETKFPFINDAMWMFTGEKKYEEYDRIDELNVIDNVTADYPDTYILCGDKDPFYSQNIEMTEKLEKKDVETISYLPKSTDKKLKHEFQRNFKLNEAHIAMDMLIDFLSECRN